MPLSPAERQQIAAQLAAEVSPMVQIGELSPYEGGREYMRRVVAIVGRSPEELELLLVELLRMNDAIKGATDELEKIAGAPPVGTDPRH